MRSARRQFWVLICLGFFAGCALVPCFAQAKSELQAPRELDPKEGEREARVLLADLLSRKPEESTTNIGVLSVRDARNKTTEVPVRFAVLATATNWISIFETTNTSDAERLVVIHAPGQPNQYLLYKQDQQQVLSGDQTMVPFANSDFWLADLGIEFLHWPRQRLLRKEMLRSQFCGVLESIRSTPATNSYARVVSWIDIDSGAIVRAEAYDSRELLKRFDPTELKKIQGRYQLEEMEMRNRRTGSRSRVKFHFESR